MDGAGDKYIESQMTNVANTLGQCCLFVVAKFGNIQAQSRQDTERSVASSAAIGQFAARGPKFGKRWKF